MLFLSGNCEELLSFQFQGLEIFSIWLSENYQKPNQNLLKTSVKSSINTCKPVHLSFFVYVESLNFATLLFKCTLTPNSSIKLSEIETCDFSNKWPYHKYLDVWGRNLKLEPSFYGISWNWECSFVNI